MFENIEITKETVAIILIGSIATFYINRALEWFHNSAKQPYFIANSVIIFPFAIYVFVAAWGKYSTLGGDAQLVMTLAYAPIIFLVYCFSVINPKFVFLLLILHFTVIFSFYGQLYFPSASTIHGDIFMAFVALPYMVYIIVQTIFNGKNFSNTLVHGWDKTLKPR